MKTLKTILTLVFCMGLLINLSSCVIHHHGKHKGWNKNSNNPHHPNSTNPGKGHGKKN